MNHQVSDFIIRIKNASLARRRTVIVPKSRMNKSLADLLVREQFLEGVKETEQEGKKVLEARIKYYKRMPSVTNIKIVSKPSIRVYTKSIAIRGIERKGHVVSVLSTSAGILSGKEAQKKGVGGELLFTLW